MSNAQPDYPSYPSFTGCAAIETNQEDNKFLIPLFGTLTFPNSLHHIHTSYHPFSPPSDPPQENQSDVVASVITAFGLKVEDDNDVYISPASLDIEQLIHLASSGQSLDDDVSSWSAPPVDHLVFVDPVDTCVQSPPEKPAVQTQTAKKRRSQKRDDDDDDFTLEDDAPLPTQPSSSHPTNRKRKCNPRSYAQRSKTNKKSRMSRYDRPSEVTNESFHGTALRPTKRGSRIKCGYKDLESQICNVWSNSERDFCRHKSTHLVDEAKAWIGIRDEPWADIMVWAMVCDAILSAAKHAEERTPWLHPMAPSTYGFTPIPESDWEFLRLALKSAKWNLRGLEQPALDKFGAIARYMVQWYAGARWVCGTHGIKAEEVRHYVRPDCVKTNCKESPGSHKPVPWWNPPYGGLDIEDYEPW